MYEIKTFQDSYMYCTSGSNRYCSAFYFFIFSTQIELRQLQGLCRKYRAPEPEITACAPMGKLGVLYFQPSYTGRTFSDMNDFYSDTYVLGV